ncbi:MAG: universal stress protein [Anaerolineales bacterium]|nr:MAG: universal stress protein [Anaerolineales bacterium]
MFKKMLLATDGSRDAKVALKYARDLALRDDSQVIVVYAFEALPPFLDPSGRDELVRRQTIEGETVAGEAVQELQEAGVEVITDIREGPAADVILRVAEARQPDLIVMGSRGRGQVASLLLGNVSHRVLAHSHVPVLIVKATPEGAGA